MSRSKALELFGKAKYLSIPRSRSVKQSWISSIPTILFSLAYSIFVVFYHLPDVIICNGPGFNSQH
jgi:beta-1,4-N-acetylglucosaminyltransferase